MSDDREPPSDPPYDPAEPLFPAAPPESSSAGDPRHGRGSGDSDAPPSVSSDAPPSGSSDAPPSGSSDAPPSGDEPADAATGGSEASPAREADGAGSGTSRKSGSGSFLRELPVLLLIAFVLAFVLRTFVVQVFFIPSGSMEPTLQIDDRMVVEKVTYRFTDIDRGDVAVFEGESFGEIDPDASSGERFVRGVGQFLGLVPASARDFVKRVIGLPGDEILIEDGIVFVNGEPLDEPYVVFPDPSDFGPVTVPDGQLFFLGDNRPNSSDSRRSLGYVPIDNVVGRAAFIIWPPENVGSLMGTSYDLPSEAPSDAESTRDRADATSAGRAPR